MAVRLAVVMCVFLVSGVALAEQYYQADPARLAELEAARCQRLQNEAALIRRRLTSPVNYQGDVAKMKLKLQQVEASAVKYCPVPGAVGASTSVKH